MLYDGWLAQPATLHVGSTPVNVKVILDSVTEQMSTLDGNFTRDRIVCYMLSTATPSAGQRLTIGTTDYYIISAPEHDLVTGEWRMDLRVA